MQQLEKRNTYTPIGAPQAGGNCGLVVKQGCEVGRVLQDLKTFSNSSDVDIPSKEESRNLRVSGNVLNMGGSPLMYSTLIYRFISPLKKGVFSVQSYKYKMD